MSDFPTVHSSPFPPAPDPDPIGFPEMGDIVDFDVRDARGLTISITEYERGTKLVMTPTGEEATIINVSKRKHREIGKEIAEALIGEQAEPKTPEPGPLTYDADISDKAAFAPEFMRTTARLHPATATEVGEMALTYAFNWAQMHANHDVPTPEKITEAAKEFEAFLKYGMD